MAHRRDRRDANPPGRRQPGYLADHWCFRGHILLVLAGELRAELADGCVSLLAAGQSYQVGSGMEAHRSSATTGARLFVVG